jgi:DNA-binding NarL/FixJ family response regulator
VVREHVRRLRAEVSRIPRVVREARGVEQAAVERVRLRCHEAALRHLRLGDVARRVGQVRAGDAVGDQLDVDRRSAGADQRRDAVREAYVMAGAVRRAPRTGDPDALTAQEVRVATAIARGLTNRQAASELFLSTKTVDFHLRQIYGKLAIRSRAELALVAARRGWIDAGA